MLSTSQYLKSTRVSRGLCFLKSVWTEKKNNVDMCSPHTVNDWLRAYFIFSVIGAALMQEQHLCESGA